VMVRIAFVPGSRVGIWRLWQKCWLKHGVVSVWRDRGDRSGIQSFVPSIEGALLELDVDIKFNGGQTRLFEAVEMWSWQGPHLFKELKWSASSIRE
jgi:hypothetical protein